MVRRMISAFGLALVLGAPAIAQEGSDAEKDDAKPVGNPIEVMEKFIEKQEVDKDQARWKERLKKPPKLTFDKSKDYFWNLKTSEGSIRIKLMPQVAPMHVSSTIYLTKLGFYDNLKFHRIIKQFMAQGGCPQGSGRGGPGYKYAGEFDPKVKHNKAGLLSMANAGPGTDGSQFFLTFVPTPWLDGKHTIFGEIVEGMDTLKKLEEAGSSRGTPTKAVTLDSASIEVKGKLKKDG